jgi:exonuclease VII small subunit
MVTAERRVTEMRRGMMDIHEHIESLQRGFIIAREVDRKLWQRNTELEKEVADLKRDSDTHSVELGSLWRELDGLRQELRSLRQHRG